MQINVLSQETLVHTAVQEDHNVVRPVNNQLLQTPASMFPLYVDHFTVATQTL